MKQAVCQPAFAASTVTKRTLVSTLTTASARSVFALSDTLARCARTLVSSRAQDAVELSLHSQLNARLRYARTISAQYHGRRHKSM